MRVTGIGKNSFAGISTLRLCLKKWGYNTLKVTDYIECERGKLKGIDMDMNTIPDAAK